jgi:hypothetical protein
MLARTILNLAVFIAALAPTFAAQSFTAVIYNVENLHDADGVAVYDDYQPEDYRPAHVATKAINIAHTLKKFRGGNGPDIVLLQEIEIDQTPGSTVPDTAAWLDQWRGTPIREMLSQNPLPAELAGVPAELWILKALQDVGITGYHLAVGSDAPSPPTSDSRRAIKCVTLSKFPITAVRNHPLMSARMILETEIEIGGASVFVLNTHWKSGASNPAMEDIRIQNAEVMRARVDEILAGDPMADIIIGGDLNAQYNQKARYPAMPRTGIDDVLEVGYSEPGLIAGEEHLYNLWFELEPSERGSDTFRGNWGTLMHIIVSRGLYDNVGVQYQDNSFNVARLPGENSDAAGAPIRWRRSGPEGSGFSDHLPIYAHFRTVDAGTTTTWMRLDDPSSRPPSGEVFPVDYSVVDLNQAIRLDAIAPQTDLRDGTWSGKLFRVAGPAVGTNRPKVRFNNEVYDIYAPQSETRDLLEAQAIKHRALEFYGELGTFRGNWQFVVRDISWVQ